MVKLESSLEQICSPTSLILHAESQDHHPSGSGEEYFKGGGGGLPYMGMVATMVMCIDFVPLS